MLRPVMLFASFVISCRRVIITEIPPALSYGLRTELRCFLDATARRMLTAPRHEDMI